MRILGGHVFEFHIPALVDDFTLLLPAAHGSGEYLIAAAQGVFRVHQAELARVLFPKSESELN